MGPSRATPPVPLEGEEARSEPRGGRPGGWRDGESRVGVEDGVGRGRRPVGLHHEHR
jgi:hypothetical protein